MHQQSMNIMQGLFNRYLDSSEHLTILDVGAADINGSYKQLMPDEWDYIGTDIEAGDGVDMVMPDAFTIPADDSTYDAVICGQVLEHCSNPFRLVQEICRVIEDEGYVFVITVAVCPYHAYPTDNFRIFPDGMKAIIDEAGLELISSSVVPADGLQKISKYKMVDCVGVGRKHSDCSSIGNCSWY